MEKRHSGLPFDRISNLPDNLTDIILSHLPIRDAVRTSTLSKNWKEKWTTVPHIVLGSSSVRGKYRDQLGSIMNYILCQHKGGIQKLRLSTDELGSCYDISTLMYKLSPTCIQDFSLEIWNGWPKELPANLFSYKWLIHLKLRNVWIQLPPSFKGFSSLISLDLHSIRVEANELRRFIHSCPVLEQLTLTKLKTIDCLNIDARSLKFFFFEGKFRCICLTTPLLLVLSIKMNNVVKKSDGGMKRFQILDFPHAIEKLSVKFFGFLALGDLMERRPTIFSHLKTLEVDKLCFKHVDELKCLISLIEISPNIQSLSVSACTKRHSDFRTIIQFWEAQEYSDSFFEQLRRVRISSFLGEYPELEFIRYVLYKSPLLEELTIEPISDCRYVETTVTRKVLGFHRASPRAEIIYLATTRYSPSDSSDSFSSHSDESSSDSYLSHSDESSSDSYSSHSDSYSSDAYNESEDSDESDDSD